MNCLAFNEQLTWDEEMHRMTSTTPLRVCSLQVSRLHLQAAALAPAEAACATGDPSSPTKSCRARGGGRSPPAPSTNRLF